MDTLQAVIMGFVQGLSEFLPVSSSAHIVFTSCIFKLITGQSLVHADNQEVFFDIIIHLATLFAVFIYFCKDLKEIVVKFVGACKNKDFKSEDARLPLYIIAGTFFTCILALVFKDYADSLLQNPKIVCLLLFATGIILLTSEKIPKKDNDINLKNSILIGIAQGLAVFPGLSRSGLTIATAVASGVSRIKAARYSFLLSIPIILGASIFYPVFEIHPSEFITYNWQAIFAGFLTSLLTGYFCIKYFMQFLAKNTLTGFAYYCFIVAAVMYFLF